MPLVFAGVTPHPPMLVPEIGKESSADVAKTKAALEKLEEELYLAQPNTIIIISPHTSYFPNAFTVNGHTHFLSYFEELGDLTTKKSWTGAPELATRIAHGPVAATPPVRLVSEEKLDYGASIPLLYLTAHLPDIRVLPLGYSGLSPKEHLAFGEHLKEHIMDSNKRIALIASGDLAHTLTKDSPAGFNPCGERFDQTLIQLLEARNTMGIASIDEATVIGAEQCGYRSILILLGLLKNIDFTFKNYCYEAPFGVGYLTGQFLF